MQQHLTTFKDHLKRISAVRQDEWELLKQKATIRNFYPGQSINALGTPQQYFIYVCSGLFRETGRNNFNENYISRYLVTGDVFIGIDPTHYIQIEAIDYCTILTLSKEDLDELEFQFFKKHLQFFLGEYIKHLQLRGDILACKTGEQKYHQFYKYYPTVCKYQPLSEQARFLGLAKDTVCRLRSRHFPDAL